MRRRPFRPLAPVVASLILAVSGSVARAVSPVPATGLEVRITETGKITLSADGTGTNDPAGSTIQADKPSAAATVRGAYLACSANFDRVINDGDVSLDGNAITWTDSVQNVGTFFNNVFSDVTPIVKPKADAAPPGLVDFAVLETASETIDGCALYVIFDDPSQPTTNTAVIFFGGQSPAGDDFAVTFAEPLVAGDSAQMGLAIGFGFQGGANLHECGNDAPQFSTIDVNTTRVTSCAGNFDDGASSNGALITVGGIGDSPANPTNPLQQAADGTLPRGEDDELYDLLPFLGPTDTLISVHTQNPSNDDDIFAGHIFVSVPAIVGEGILLSPETAQNPTGTQHTLTATVVDDNGAPVVGREVAFNVVSGPNAGANGTDTSDADGIATFTYTGSGGPGLDTIEASFVDSQGNTQTSSQVTKEWTEVPSGEKTICSELERHRFKHKTLPDVDVFRFQGTAGEQVTIDLEMDPSEPSRGTRAILALVDHTSGLTLLALDKGALPGQIVATLPASGEYFIVVSQPLKCRHHKKRDHHRGCRRFDGFQGDYCLTLASDGGAFETLAPTRTVEQ